MPGEYVNHVYAGPMERETLHFLEAVAYDRPVMVDPRLARAHDGGLPGRRPFGRNQVVDLPLPIDESQPSLLSVITG